MKKPVKKYNDTNPKLQIRDVEVEEAFYMCEFVDLAGAKPEKQEMEQLDELID